MSHGKRYNRRSVRVPRLDFRRRGIFLVTICTHERRQILGSYIHDQIRLSSIGSIVEDCIEQIPLHYRFSRVLAHSIQSDHIHVLVELNAPYRDTVIDLEGFQHPVSGSIPTIIRSLKAAITKAVRNQSADPKLLIWQRGYDLRPIKTPRALFAVRYYVKNNTTIHIRRLHRRNGHGASSVDTGRAHHRYRHMRYHR